MVCFWLYSLKNDDGYIWVGSFTKLNKNIKPTTVILTSLKLRNISNNKKFIALGKNKISGEVLMKMQPVKLVLLQLTAQ